MDLSAWFHWVFASPGYFLLALVGLIVLFGLIGGLTDSRTFNGADDSSLGEEEPHSGKPWWRQEEQHYREWNAYQVRERDRDNRASSDSIEEIY
jgi:hypothetical protein